MPLLLKPTIHLTRLGDELVILDISRDRYLFLDASRSAQLFRADAAPASPAPPWFAQYTSEQGLRLSEAIRRNDTLTAGCVEEFGDTVTRVPPTAIARAALLTWRTARVIRRTSFSRVLSALEQQRSPARQPASTQNPMVHSIVAAHHRAALVTGSGTTCLPRAIALIRHLAAHGLHAQLVIGVKLGPFAAHAWVRSGDHLLNDSLESVRRFRPILDL